MCEHSGLLLLRARSRGPAASALPGSAVRNAESWVPPLTSEPQVAFHQISSAVYGLLEPLEGGCEKTLFPFQPADADERIRGD